MMMKKSEMDSMMGALGGTPRPKKVVRVDLTKKKASSVRKGRPRRK